jgi:solute carrier family 25 (mitochondrial phosphate transporter), member 3
MCPFETIKCQVQTRTTGPSRLVPAFWSMIESAHPNRSVFPVFFQSLPALWARQIPGTIVNFYTFENTVQFIYSNLPNDKSSYTWPQQLCVTFFAGYTAGFCSAVISHPADSLVSYMATTRQSASTIVRTVGLWRLATQGLAPRIVVTGSIISAQWLLYDTFKSALGYGTSGCSGQ